MTIVFQRRERTRSVKDTLARRFFGTLVLCGAILVCGMAPHLLQGTYASSINDALANDYTRTASGELWRPLTSWLVHSDLEHLAWDIAYLAMVCCIVERRYGTARCVIVFLACTWAGSLAGTLLDRTYAGVVGSSAGAHGVLAYFCLREAANSSLRSWYRVMAFCTIGYLIYLGVSGVVVGRMGWPFVFFENCGFDHLGGIGTAVVLGAGEALWMKWQAAHDKGGAKDDRSYSTAVVEGGLGEAVATAPSDTAEDEEAGYRRRNRTH